MSLAPLPKKKVYQQISENFATPEDIPEGSLPFNRYKNSLPNPGTRVKLNPIPDVEHSDYINANHVRGAEGTPKYIATMGPLQKTLDHFWRMVWEKDVHVIVMLTGLYEGTVRKCSGYWPANRTHSQIKTSSGIQIRWVKSQPLRDDVVQTNLKVIWKDEERELTHLIYAEFPDHGVPPSTKAFLGLVEYARRLNKPEHPLLVHCSAGIGRTGMFVATDIAVDILQKDGKVNLSDITTKMREDRGGMIQHYKQFQFVHEAIEAYIDGAIKEYHIDDNLDQIKAGAFASQLFKDSERAEVEGEDSPIWAPFAPTWLDTSDNWAHKDECEIDDVTGCKVWCTIKYYELGQEIATFNVSEMQCAIGCRKDRKVETSFSLEQQSVGTDSATKKARAEFGDGFTLQQAESGNVTIIFKCAKPIMDMKTFKPACNPKKPSTMTVLLWNVTDISAKLHAQIDEGVDDEVMQKMVQELASTAFYFGKEKEKGIKKGKPPTAHITLTYDAAAVEIRRACAEVDRQIRREPPLELRPD